MKELLTILYYYLAIGAIIQVVFFKRLSDQAQMMSGGNTMDYVFIVLGFVIMWPKILLEIIKNKE